MSNLEKSVFFAMLDSGALTPGKDDRSFNINFKIIQERFPSFLEFMVRSSLSDIEEWAYLEGYMAYEITPEGLLAWKVTGKLYRKDDCF